MTTSHRETVMMTGRLKGMGREAECTVSAEKVSLPHLNICEYVNCDIHLAPTTSSIEVMQLNGLGQCSPWIWRRMKHEPIVLERNDFRITKAACSCGAELQLASDVGSVREQFQKLVAAFQKHMMEKETARQKLL